MQVAPVNFVMLTCFFPFIWWDFFKFSGRLLGFQEGFNKKIKTFTLFT